MQSIGKLLLERLLINLGTRLFARLQAQKGVARIDGSHAHVLAKEQHLGIASDELAQGHVPPEQVAQHHNDEADACRALGGGGRAAALGAWQSTEARKRQDPRGGEAR